MILAVPLYLLLGWTGTDWYSGAYWIGGKKVAGTWMWDGLVSGEIDYDWWDVGQPSDNGLCLNFIDTTSKFDDAACSDTIKFFCEKTA